jgi:SAM-dependent methyltransferase
MAKTDFDGYLKEFLVLYPANPSQAYWRAIEAALLQDEDYSAPLLDLGCGDGSFASVLFGRLGIKPDSACDLSAVKTAVAQARNVYAEARTADILSLPYPDASFETVFSNCVLEHIPDDAAALREAARVLRPGGRLVFTVPSENFTAALPAYKVLMARGLEQEAGVYAQSMDKRLEHFHYRSPTEWKDFLAPCGFFIIKADYYMSGREEALWARSLRAEDVTASFPWPASSLLRKVMKFTAPAIMRRIPGGPGGSLLIIAKKND